MITTLTVDTTDRITHINLISGIPFWPHFIILFRMLHRMSSAMLEQPVLFSMLLR
jgi:hypothetical protein